MLRRVAAMLLKASAKSRVSSCVRDSTLCPKSPPESRLAPSVTDLTERDVRLDRRYPMARAMTVAATMATTAVMITGPRSASGSDLLTSKTTATLAATVTERASAALANASRH